MRSEGKQRLRWAIASMILFVVGLAGLPDDINTWLSWIEGLLVMVNHDVVRWLFVVGGFVAVYHVVYTRGMRADILYRFRLGQRVCIAKLDTPLSSQGWNVVEGEEPICMPCGKDMVELKSGSLSQLEYVIDNPDPFGRYLICRGGSNAFGIRTIGHFPLAFTIGCDIELTLRVRRAVDDCEILVQLMPNFDLPTTRCGGKHSWVIHATSFVDYYKDTQFVIDINDVLRREYTRDKYEFLGICGIVLRVYSAALSPITIHQRASLRERVKVAFNRTTWLPWS